MAIKTLQPMPTLKDFTVEGVGHRLWDSYEVQLILRGEVIFQLVMNEYIERDAVGLIDTKTNQWTANVDRYVVEGYCTIRSTNYLFLKEVKPKEAKS